MRISIDYNNHHNCPPISLVFDDSHKQSMRFYSSYKTLKRRFADVRNGAASIAFADDRFVAGVQAADLLGCLTVREHKKGSAAWAEGTPSRDLLYDADDPTLGLHYKSEWWDRSEIEKRSADVRTAAASR
jgi:hypothetical protein